MKKIFPFLLLLQLTSYGQVASEIYMFDLESKNNMLKLSKPVNITNHKGYDNQPFFHPSKPLIYYSSFNDSGRSDINYYNYRANKTIQFTNTPEREYSPILTPDGKFISCIIQWEQGEQELGKYPVKGGKPETIIATLKVGYHVWIDEQRLLLFVLGDSNQNFLHYFNLSTKEDKVIANNPGRSLHKIPGTNSFSFIEKVNKEEWLIKKFTPSTNELSTIIHTLAGREDITWLNNGIIISSDGNNLFYFDTKSNSGWQPIIVENKLPAIKGISRLSVNSTNTKLAVVVSE
ncbi:MAG: TolB family protein [Chitinophagaceae bacterium]